MLGTILFCIVIPAVCFCLGNRYGRQAQEKAHAIQLIACTKLYSEATKAGQELKAAVLLVSNELADNTHFFVSEVWNKVRRTL